MAGILPGANPIEQEGTHKLLDMPEWVGYTFGSFFILIGITLFFMYPKAKRNSEHYRVRQLDEFKKQNPKKSHYTYQQTGMFLPAWEKTKLFAPVLGGMVMVILGIAWIAGQTIFSM